MYAGVPNAVCDVPRAGVSESNAAGSSTDGSRSRCAIAEVDDLHVALPRQEHVRGLHVAVHDAALVRVREPARDLRADRRDRLGARASASSRAAAESEKPVDVLEHEVHLRARSSRSRASRTMFGCESSDEDARLALELRARTTTSARSCVFSALSATVRAERLLHRLVDRRDARRSRAPRRRGSCRTAADRPSALDARSDARSSRRAAAGRGARASSARRRRCARRRGCARSCRRRSRRGAAPGSACAPCAAAPVAGSFISSQLP